MFSCRTPINDPFASGFHDPAASGFHDPFVRGGHDPAISGFHDPTASGGHDAAISGFHDPFLSGGHDAGLSVLHDPVLSGGHDAVISGLHDPLYSAAHSPELSAAHDPLFSAAHDPALSADHDPALSGLHDPAFSLSGEHSADLSTFHSPVNSAAHDATLSGVHNPIFSGAHDSTLSFAHNPVVSDLTSVDGEPPVVDFDLLFGDDLIEDALAVSQVRQESPLYLHPSVLRAAGSRTAQLGGGCSLSELTTQSYTLAPLRDVVAIALGYGAGAQLASLGTCVQVILPSDFAFSEGWDTPPAGALFHLEDDLDGLILAPVGSAPPSEFPERSLEFFLPAAIPTLDSGFNALTFTGVSGTRVEDFVASFGGAVTAVFRFNSATQQSVQLGHAAVRDVYSRHPGLRQYADDAAARRRAATGGGPNGAVQPDRPFAGQRDEAHRPPDRFESRLLHWRERAD